MGATDSPASVATSEVHLSRIDEPEVLVAQYHEATPYDFDDTQEDNDSEANSLLAGLATFFKKLPKFSEQSDEDTMIRQSIEALQGQLSELTLRFNDAFPLSHEKDNTKIPNEDGDSNQRFNSLLEKVNQLEALLNRSLNTDEKYEMIKHELQTLTEKFNAALQEQPSTYGGEHDGDGKDLSACM